MKPSHKLEAMSGLLKLLVFTQKCFISALANALCSVLMRLAGWAEWRDMVIRKQQNGKQKDLGLP